MANNEIRLTFPNVPSSVNACYRSYGRRVIKSKRLLDYQAEIAEIFAGLDPIDKLEGELRLTVAFHLKGKRHIDLDNMFKALLDSLEGVCFEDDKMIVELHATKVNHCADPSTVIVLTTLDQVGLV
jgi:Holliday junction resolvase RusA-like endonuclease